MSDGKSESDISEVLRRKRAAEGGETDEKAKRREDILKRIEERKKQRETDSPKAPEAQPNRTEIVILEQKVHSLENQLKEFQSQKDFDVSQINSNHQKELTKLNSTVDQLQKKLEELENAHKLKLSESSKSEENEISQLKTKLESQEQEKNKLATENATLQSQIKDISSEKTNLEKKIQENQGNLSDTSSTISKLENDNKNLENEVAAQKETIKKLENEIQSLKKKGENSETEKQNLQNKVNKAEKEFEDSKEFFETQLAKLNAELKEKEHAIEALHAKTATLEKSFTETANNLAQKVEEAEKSAPKADEKPEPEQKVEKKQEEPAKAEPSAEIKTPAEENKKAEHPEANKQGVQAFATDLLNEINKLRANPKKYVEFVENFGKFDGLKLQTQSGHNYQTKEGYEAVMDAIKFLQSSNPAQQLKLVQGLSLSCQYLCDQNGPVGKTESDCHDGTSSADRLNKYGKWRGRVMELTSFGPRSNVAKDVLYQWLIDDGNSARTQRSILLDDDFSVAGIGSAPHSKLDQMAVLAVARRYDSLEDLKNQEEAGPTNSNLRETSDGNNYLIVSEPCRIPKANIKLFLKGAHLKAVLSAVDGEPSKTATLQWNLPFEVPPGNIRAIYNEATEIEITIRKYGSSEDSVITDFSIAPNESSTANRLKIHVDQQSNVIAFVLDPCNCKVDITIKVIDGNTLCFDSLYTEVTPNPDGSKVTKATNRKEKIQMPFAISATDVTWVQTENKGYSVSVKKPSGTKEEIEIPIQ